MVRGVIEFRKPRKNWPLATIHVFSALDGPCRALHGSVMEHNGIDTDSWNTYICRVEPYGGLCGEEFDMPHMHGGDYMV